MGSKTQRTNKLLPFSAHLQHITTAVQTFLCNYFGANEHMLLSTCKHIQLSPLTHSYTLQMWTVSREEST